MGSKRSGSSGSTPCASGSTTAWPPTASPAPVADSIYEKIKAFAAFGFAESHSISVRAAGATPRPGSSGTTRRRSARRCSTPSRWGSTRRSHWSTTRSGTASRSASPRSTCRRLRRALEARRRPVPVRRAWTPRSRPSGSGWPSVRTIGTDLAETIVDRARRGTARTPRWPTSPGGSGCRPTRSRRWPPRARSTASGCLGARRCGGRARRPPPVPGSSTSSPSTRRRHHGCRR